MLHARLFGQTAAFRDSHFQPFRGSMQSLSDVQKPQESYLDGNATIDRPLFVQFCANNPDELLEAARYVEPYCDAVDLNLGCPQGIAKKGHYGAFLQEDWDLIYSLINKLHKELSIPVTAKLRILDTKEKTLEYARMILSAGASLLTVHGRRREQKGHNTGLAEWSVIRYLRDNLPPETVIFANGNILNGTDIEKCLEATGADGVMSAEANLSDPTLFSGPPKPGEEGREFWRGDDGKGGYRMDAVLRRYLDIIYKYVLETEPPSRCPLFVPTDPQILPNDRPETISSAEHEPPKKKHKANKSSNTNSPNLRSMQGHLFQLLRPLISKHTNIRDTLAKCRPGDMKAFENVLSMVEGAVSEGLQEYARDPGKFDAIGEDEEAAFQTSAPASRAKVNIAIYRRPWWVCQPYIRPLPEEAIQNGALTLGKKEKAKLASEAQVPAVASLEPNNQRPVLSHKDDFLKTEGQSKEALVCG